MEIFVSSDGTQYKWDRKQENMVALTQVEVQLLKMKVSLMSDEEIMNRESGNGTPMGIPVTLGKERLEGIKSKLVDVLKAGPFIGFEQHAIERIVTDSLLDDEDPSKRGWTSIEEAEGCILKAKRVTGVRLNVNHKHPKNTQKVKHLQQHFALVIEGQKTDGKGRLVLVILKENEIRVITVL